MKLVVGLGNPGSRYEHNRHNIGFQILDEIAAAWKRQRLQRVGFARTEHRAQTLHSTFEGQRVILAKPQTWMNESGRSVGAIVRYYKIPPACVFVIYDDLDIPLGTLRFRQEGSSGGHKGVQSIIQHLDTRAFPRLRLGIGRPPGRMPPAAYVLQDFSKDEQPLLWDVPRKARVLVEGWLTQAPWSERQGRTWRIEDAGLGV
jgi:PTH1 family peptidyl-tRNA hydrolase